MHAAGEVATINSYKCTSTLHASAPLLFRYLHNQVVERATTAMSFIFLQQFETSLYVRWEKFRWN